MPRRDLHSGAIPTSHGRNGATPGGAHERRRRSLLRRSAERGLSGGKQRQSLARLTTLSGVESVFLVIVVETAFRWSFQDSRSDHGGSPGPTEHSRKSVSAHAGRAPRPVHSSQTRRQTDYQQLRLIVAKWRNRRVEPSGWALRCFSRKAARRGQSGQSHGGAIRPGRVKPLRIALRVKRKPPNVKAWFRPRSVLI